MSDYQVGDIGELIDNNNVDKELKRYPLGTKFIVFEVVEKTAKKPGYCVCRIQYDPEKKLYNIPFNC